MSRPHESAAVAPVGHPVVGAWTWDIAADVRPGARTFSIFHADGTFVETHPFLGTGIGIWRATGERTADLFIAYHDRDAGAVGTGPDWKDPGIRLGILTSRGTLEMDESGNAQTYTSAYEMKTLDGAVVHSGTSIETATRLTVEGL